MSVRTLDNGVLWHIVFAPFVDPRDKEVARAELRRRGLYGEPIVAIEKREEGQA